MECDRFRVYNTYDSEVGKLLLEGPSPASFFITEIVTSLGTMRAMTIF